MVEALDIHVQGIVQGVGFRPFVYRMAKKYLISGWVLNAADGVYVHAEGESKLLDEFVLELSDNAPAAAQVKQIELKEVPLEGFDGFEIRFSNEGAVEQTTLVSPELATCDDCLREMGNPNDRRFHYPFVNCTNCGPRFTIIEELPYDRKSTSMREFEMCDRCAAEYADPLDRRFHAQPDACFECGPVVSFVCSDGAGGFTGATVRYGTTLEESDAIFAEAAEMLAQGKIVAVKGLGGYHLVCDARNAQAVATLRERKRREGKAFAVMMSDVVAVREVCEVNEVEESLLSGAQRPIVLLKKRSDAVLAPRLADGLSELGVMLPYTPVQHLLLDAFAKALASGAARQASSLEGAARQALSSAASLSQDVALRAAASDASLPSVASNDNVSHETFVPLEGAEGADYGDAARADASAGCDAQGNAALSDSAQAGDSQGASWATFSPDGDVSRETSVPVCVVSAHGEVVAGDSLAGAFAHCEPWSIGAPMLVMTSGNIHDEPIAIGNEEAQEKLAEVADAFLGNNRAILTRFDDSVVRVVKAGSAGYALQFVRRARGYAPSPLPLALTQRAEGPSVIFATGPEQKNTFTLLRTNAHVNASADADAGSDISEPGRADVSSEAGMVSSNRPTATAASASAVAMDAVTAAGSINADAFVSQHIGDMENAETYDAWLEAKRRYEGLFELEPQVVACDMHPEYLTSKWAHENARQPRAGQFDETRFEKSGQKGEGASLSGELCCEQQAGSTETHDGQRAGSAETRDEQRAARDEDCTERLASPSAGTSLVEVQHHHAHIVSAMAENNLSEAVCGIAFDGTGYGVDGCIWGGEVLLSNLADFERFANFAYVPMPGGAAAIKNPLRMAYGALWAFDLLEHPAATRLLDTLGAQAGLCEQMIEQGINTPMTSSVGRLFDAASAILGICTKPSYEGEGAILLEAAIHSACLGVANAGALVAAPNTDNGAIGAACPDADPSDPADGAAAFSLDNGAVGTDCAATPDSGSANAACPNDGSGVAPAANAAVASDADADAAERYAVAVTKNVATESSTARDTSVVLLDAAPTFRALLDDVQAGVPTPTIARRFHEAMIGAVVVSAELVRAVYGIDTVALSGGVFMNRYLLEGSLARLERAGFSVAVNRDLPPNDGCISVGQAVVAWAKSQYAEGEPAAQ